MKRIFHVLLALCMLLLLLQPLAAGAAGNSTVYVRKHVSILYDDSGSMQSHNPGQGNLKWCYASYAAQVFTGLLNDTDTLSITFMSGKVLKDIDLAGLRQNAVTSVLNNTATADGDTPLGQIRAALSVLTAGGLQPGRGTNPESEQFWLVLTTDGVFWENGSAVSIERVVDEIVSVLEEYPDLHVVYFGIGMQGTGGTAVDFRANKSSVDKSLLDKLHSHPSFTAVYAENQDQIVSTMQGLSNQISGRYSVTNDCTVSGNQVQIYLPAEGSPIRNIAVMAQQTDAELVSAVAANGTELTIDRTARIRYPQHTGYDNVPAGTLGGYTALITGPSGEKIPSGNVTLTFSEPVNKSGLSLMYEPAIHINLTIERKTPNGEWEPVLSGSNLIEGDEIRVNYAVCEDGTDKALDTDKLFGKTEATILLNGDPVRAGESIAVAQGDSLLEASVSMMDGGYRIDASRSFHVGLPGADSFTIESSGPIELLRTDAAGNDTLFVEFTVLLRGEPAPDSYTADFSLHIADGALAGDTAKPAGHIFRFTPKDATCEAGTYTVELLYQGKVAATEQIRILPNETTFTAEAGPSISIMSNHVADNTDSVSFTVTAHRDDGDGPINAAEAGRFTIRAEGDGQTVSGRTDLAQDGVLAFTLQDADAVPGTYTVSLLLEGEVLAQTSITVVKYDATYTIETVISDPDTIDRFAVEDNTANVAFIVYEDGVPCTAEQLESMLDRQIFVSEDLQSAYVRVNVSIGVVNGKPAVICTPGSTTGSGLLHFLRRFPIACHLTRLNRSEMNISLRVEMPRGAEATGRLTIAGERPIYFIITLVLLVILLLVAVWIILNLKVYRLKKGIIWSFTVSNSQREGLQAKKASSGTSLGIGWQLIPHDETHGIGTLTFGAEKRNYSSKTGGGRFGFRRCHPVVSVSGRTSELEQYYHAKASDLASELLLHLKHAREPITVMSENGRSRESLRRFEDDYFSLIQQFPLPEKERGTATVAISDSHYLVYRKQGSGESVSYTVYVYEATAARGAAARRRGGRRRPAGRRRRR